MKKIDDYGKVAHLISEIEVDKVYPMSILEGYQSGEVWVDDTINPSFCLFWHYCGFAYIAGKYDDQIVSEIIEFMHNPSEGHSGRLALQTGIDERIQSMILKDEKVQKKEQYLFYFPEKKSDSLGVKYDFEIQPIDSANYALFSGRIIPAFSWESEEQFLKYGFGYCIMQDKQFVACAFSSGISDEYVDIGVETSEDFRGKGYGKIVAMAMIEEIFRRKKIPVWECDVTNEASRNLACSLGFEIRGTHPLYLI